MISTAFSFFLRLFLCFVAARFLLQAIEVSGRGYLVGLTILLLVNVYLFSYLVFRERTPDASEGERVRPEKPGRASPAAAEPPEDQSPPPA
ncbi:MAG: hypothetical protein P8168_08830 [Deltaproteobacteria bacterium]|jgi:hypothetical protein